jgi:hypothetical protein
VIVDRQCKRVVQAGRRCFYLRNHHQSATPAVPMMAVMAVEINSESAANLRAPRTMTILLLDLPPPWRDARFQY